MLFSFIVCAEVERQAGKEARFEHADEEARRQEAGIVRDEGGANDRGGPREYKEGDEAGWAGFLKDQGGRDFEDDVGYCGKLVPIQVGSRGGFLP